MVHAPRIQLMSETSVSLRLAFFLRLSSVQKVRLFSPCNRPSRRCGRSASSPTRLAPIGMGVYDLTMAPPPTPTSVARDAHVMLKTELVACTDVSFALLVGSQARAAPIATSDWDIALWIRPDLLPWQRHLALVDTQHRIARALQVDESAIDLIDLRSAGLAMRAEVANHGLLLKQDAHAAYNRFLVRTWRELEEVQQFNSFGLTPEALVAA